MIGSDGSSVTLKAVSYRRLLERVRVAEALRDYAFERQRRTDEWAQQELCSEIRRLQNRVTFLYGAARAHGATVEELGQDT